MPGHTPKEKKKKKIPDTSQKARQEAAGSTGVLIGGKAATKADIERINRKARSTGFVAGGETVNGVRTPVTVTKEEFNRAKGSQPVEERSEKLGTEKVGEPGTELAPKGEQINKEEVEIRDIRIQLAQPETGKVLDSINKWRLEIKLSNLETKQKRIAAGEISQFGVIPISGLGAGTANIGTKLDGAGRQIGIGQAGQSGGLIGFEAIANNAKTAAKTGLWVKRAGFTGRASVAVGSLIGLTAWGKHVKSEAIEFLPFQISKAREAGDEATAQELTELFFEIKDPTGWANLIEEVPGLGVIKAALDKSRVGGEVIRAQERRE